jgi:inhibitor of cysteine peptidase
MKKEYETSSKKKKIYYNIKIEKGWQLIGFPYTIKDMGIFDKESTILWKYNNKTKTWEGYSSDENINKKINDNNISKMNQIEHYSGVWIKSEKSWWLSIPKYHESNIITDINSTIELSKGWNLISIPGGNVYSNKIFDGLNVWKYNDNNWSVNGDSDLYPQIKNYNTSDAVWVKSDINQTIDINQNSVKLFNFETKDKLKEYIRNMLVSNLRPYYGYFNLPEIALDQDNTLENVSDASKTTVENASTTNTQETDVDEADILKHNGDLIFYINKNSSTISVTNFTDVINGANTFDKNKSINLTEGSIAQETYLINNKLIVISNYDNWYNYSPLIVDDLYPEYYYKEPKTLIDFYDINGSNNIIHTKQITLSGSYKTSRVANGKLYFISTFYPHVDVEYEKEYLEDDDLCLIPTTWEERRDCYNINSDANGSYRYNYEKYTITKEYLLPQSYENNSSIDLIEAQNFYSSMKLNQDAHITTTTQIDINTTSIDKSISVLGYMNDIYASTESIYLTSNQYPLYYTFDQYKEKLAIYRLSLQNDISYSSVGYIEGKTLNQFSMSEYNNTLRIATTEGFSWGANGTNNRVYTLQDNNETLSIIGKLENLGKENEIIHAVRFIKNRGYVVTAVQTDPFYTIDLSNPSNPIKMGELEIEGVSTYLHPINDDLVLSIGNTNTIESNSNFKLELYDISDFSNPTSTDKITINSSYYNGDHKSYTFRNNLLAMNILKYTYNSYGYLFEVDTNTKSLYTKLSTSLDESYQSNPYYTRSIIYDRNGTSYVTFFNSNSIKTEIFAP